MKTHQIFTLLLAATLCNAIPSKTNQETVQNYSKVSSNYPQNPKTDILHGEENSSELKNEKLPQNHPAIESDKSLDPQNDQVSPKMFLNQYQGDRESPRGFGEGSLRVKKGVDEEVGNTINAHEADGRENKMGKVKKRSYGYRGNVRRAVPVSIYEANSLWKPSAYQISRPYYIPVYGFANQRPIFYPPQSYPGNPGAPKDNPLKPPYVGPSYLPPDEPTGRPQRPKKPTGRPGSSTQMPLIDKFDEDDDAPVWGELPTNMMHLNADDEDDEGDNLIPTRPPSPSVGQINPAFPPLVRPGGNRPGGNAVNRPAGSGSAVNRPSFETNRPGARPPPPTRPAPPAAPQSTTQSPARLPSGPNNCVWAIISCCSVGNPSTVPEACFEQRGCAGPFWGASPCDSEFARTAIETAIKYYNSGGV